MSSQGLRYPKIFRTISSGKNNFFIPLSSATVWSLCGSVELRDGYLDIFPLHCRLGTNICGPNFYADEDWQSFLAWSLPNFRHSVTNKQTN